MAIEPVPGNAVPIVLSRHRDLDHPPVFHFRALRRSETKKMAAALRLMREADTQGPGSLAGEDALDAMEAILVDNLLGWENQITADGQAVPFDPGRFPELVTEGDMGELVASLRAGGLTQDDVGKSSLPSRASKPGPAAPTDAAPAPHTNPAPPSPSRSSATTAPGMGVRAATEPASEPLTAAH